MSIYQADALNLFIANLSRDATEEIVGSGQRTHNPEGAIQQKQAKKEEEKETQTNFNILIKVKGGLPQDIVDDGHC